MLTSPKVSGRTSIFNWWDKFELFQSGTLVYIQNEKCYLLKTRAPSSVLQDSKKISSINMINISWYATICIIVLQVCRCADRKHVLCSIVQLVKKKKRLHMLLENVLGKLTEPLFLLSSFLQVHFGMLREPQAYRQWIHPAHNTNKFLRRILNGKFLGKFYWRDWSQTELFPSLVEPFFLFWREGPKVKVVVKSVLKGLKEGNPWP